jgi:serine/threonine-protein kinase
MAADPRVFGLVEQMLNSGEPTEIVCRDCPELVGEVRARWQDFCRIDAEIAALFPEPDMCPRAGAIGVISGPGLPHVPGYDVEALLGQGGMGAVYKARQRALNRPVAVKMLLAGAFAVPQELARFRREAEALAALRHPNIVQVYDAGAIEGRPYFAMELVDGGNLAQQLAVTPQPIRHAAELVAVLAGAVQFAHRSGIIHRDLKPANILLSADGTPKITDFGVALLLEGGSRFTVSGARVGTPSYMAPEQALGKVSAIGPSVDIYALGAVLYELLTGRPPFEGETAAETERRVVGEEPVPPSRLNGRVPRDLETICLKCLHKNSARRYASAQDLADDLHRFLDKKPVLARPVGFVERAAKWVRRRPVLATLLTALLVVLGVAIGIGLFLQQQSNAHRAETTQREGRAREAIKSALTDAYKSGQAQDWEAAERTLADAANYVADAADDQLHRQLDQAKIHLQFARSLEGIRQKVAKNDVLAGYFVPTTSYETLADDYERAFAQGHFDIPGAAAAAAARIGAEPLAGQIIAALDEWAFAAFMLKRESLQKHLLQIAQLADPDPLWRDRFRDPALWRNARELLKLADDASANSPAAHHLAITGALLSHLGEKAEETRLLRDALHRRPGDYWLNWALADALNRANKHAESATYWRVVNALRPGNSGVVNRLGTSIFLAGDLDEAIRQLHRVLELEPANTLVRHNLAVVLMRAGRFGEAETECRRAVAAHPDDSYVHHALALVLRYTYRFDESIAMFQKAIALNPVNPAFRHNFGHAARMAGRLDSAVSAFQETIRLDPKNIEAHWELAQILPKLGRHDEATAEFLWIIREFDPAKNRAGTGFPDALDPRYIDARVGLSESLMFTGRFKQGIPAARSALELPTLSALALPTVDASRRQALRRQLEICQQLAPLETNLATILANNDPPADLATRRALAEWCYKYGSRPVTAVRLFEGLFLKQPALAEDLQTHDRFHAACAAALAATGHGRDAGKLTEQERTLLRQKSLTWLKADRDAWVKRFKQGKTTEQEMARRTVGHWQENDDLACVRDMSALAKLPEKERKEWQAVWADVKALAPPDPSSALQQARLEVARKQWAQAAETYRQIFKDRPNQNDSEIWFELAAVQLLSGDRQGYRQTCQRMLAGAPNALQLRSYLVARACTLAPDSVADANMPARASMAELMLASSAFWSLTEQGALLCRQNQPREAMPCFERSLKADERPGSAVLNWLWLSLASHNLGEKEQARRWLDKANRWLDRLGDAMPANAESTLGLHLHNWLEAQVLRREASALFSPPAK